VSKIPVYRSVTEEQLTTWLEEAADLAREVWPVLNEKTTEPGRAVLACVLIASRLCDRYQELPPLEWYVGQMIELRDSALKSQAEGAFKKQGGKES
jgi:hypothetical protein